MGSIDFEGREVDGGGCKALFLLPLYQFLCLMSADTKVSQLDLNEDVRALKLGVTLPANILVIAFKFRSPGFVCMWGWIILLRI